MQTASRAAKRGRPTGIGTIEPEELLRLLAGGPRVLVVDVRESAEIEQSRRSIPGAVHVPLHELFVRRAELPLGRVDTVVTVSNEGALARAAALTISLLGFTDVRVLEGGLERWAAKRFPLV